MSGRVGAEQTPDIETLAAAFDPHQREVMTGACICGDWPPPNHDISWSEHLAAALAPVLAAAWDEARAAELREAADDIKARVVTFRTLDAHPEYMNALNDAWGLVANRVRRADRIAVDAPEPHEHDWQRRQNVTTKGYRMAPIEVCQTSGCDAARVVAPEGGEGR